MVAPRKDPAAVASEFIRLRCTPAAKALILRAVKHDGSTTLSGAVLDAALLWAAHVLGLPVRDTVERHGHGSVKRPED